MCLKLGIPPSNGQLKTGQSDDDWIILDPGLMSVKQCQYFDAYTIQIVKLGMVQHNWGITTLNLFQPWYLFPRAIQLDETPHPACTGCRNRRNRTPWRSEQFVAVCYRKQPILSGWWLTYPSEKYESQMGVLFPIYGTIKEVPNHQPVITGISWE